VIMGPKAGPEGVRFGVEGFAWEVEGKSGAFVGVWESEGADDGVKGKVEEVAP